MPANDPTTNATPSFEQALGQLQQSVAELEGGQLSLDESLQRYEAALRLLRIGYQHLERAEQKIEQLISLDAQGGIETAPFDAQATHSAPAAGKPTRKKATKQPVESMEEQPRRETPDSRDLFGDAGG